VNTTQNSTVLKRLAEAGRKNKKLLDAISASPATANPPLSHLATSTDRFLRSVAESSRILRRLGAGRTDR
jgi:hypothetical protein